MASRPITLALGGGGARGVAHLGAIEVLIEGGIEIERIVGVSIGSLAGAMFAFDPDIERTREKALDYLLSDSFQSHQRALFGTKSSSDEAATGGVFSWYDRVKTYLRANRHFHRIITRPALLPGVVLHDVVDHLLPESDISESKIPLAIVAVDLISGSVSALERGPVRDAVRASSSLPGIFPPVRIEDKLLCDIGVFFSLPTTVARQFTPSRLIAIDVSSDVRPLPDCETGIDVLMRMDEIAEALFRKQVRSSADLVIRPSVSDTEWFDFGSPKELIESGRAAAREALPAVHAILAE